MARTFVKTLTAHEALLITRFRLGYFDIVINAKGWRIVMRKAG